MSGADRKAKHVASRNEIGDLPPVRHPRVLAACRYDLVRFGRLYCRALLDHAPSALMVERLVSKLQSVVLDGGQLAVLFSRGAGKTTWIEIAFMWAMLYGHRRFPICIAASKQLAKSIKNTILHHLEASPEIAADFPAVAIPLRAVGGIVQRAASLTYHGRPIGFASSELSFTLPSLADDLARPLSPACGATFACRGVGASVRGLNEYGLRPDLVLFDDPQTQKDAAGQNAVDRLDRYIHSDALGLAANTSTMAALITITPQKINDLASRITDRSQHPNWSVTRCPFVVRKCEGFDDLAAEFVAAYHDDVAADDFARSRSVAWYRENAARFEGTVVVDPLAYDRVHEVDAVHHALNKIAAMGAEAFAAEYQMDVASASGELVLTVESVTHRLSGAAEYVLPPGTSAAVAFCDVNVKKGEGLSYVVLAVGSSRVASVIHYGRYPSVGPVVPPNASDLQRKRAVGAAIRHVVQHLIALPLRAADTRRKVNLAAIGFDRGYLPDVVSRSLFVIRSRFALPCSLVMCRGAGWSQFSTGPRADLVGRGDHIEARKSQYGQYLSVHAPYWREVAQSGLLETPLMPGSLCLFGADPLAHRGFAAEVCAERLICRYVHPSGKLAWDWAVSGANHFGDALTGAFAVASWFRLYDALPRVLDSAALTAPPPADLFDPSANPALAERVAAVPAAHVTGNLKTLDQFRRSKLPPVAAPRKPRAGKIWKRR